MFIFKNPNQVTKWYNVGQNPNSNYKGQYKKLKRSIWSIGENLYNTKKKLKLKKKTLQTNKQNGNCGLVSAKTCSNL